MKRCLTALLAILLILSASPLLSGCDLSFVEEYLSIERNNSASTESTTTTNATVATEAETQPTVETSPVMNGHPAVVIMEEAKVHADFNPATYCVEVLTGGTTVYISAVSHYGDSVMLYIGKGWISLQDVRLDGSNQYGIIPCTVKQGPLNYRIGPGTEYDTAGMVYNGDVVNVSKICVGNSDRMLWGMMHDGKWVCLDYVTLPEGIALIEGINGEATDPEKTETPYGQIKQVPNDTQIVGPWRLYTRDDFLSFGTWDFTSWTFNSDGSFFYQDYDYMYYSGQIRATGSSYGQGGIFTYDGTTLILQYEYSMFMGEKSYYDKPNVQTYTASIENWFLTFGDTIMFRNYKVDTPNAVLQMYMSLGTKSHVNTRFIGAWQKSNGGVIVFNNDGTFSESYSNNETATGTYLFVNNDLYLSYKESGDLDIYSVKDYYDSVTLTHQGYSSRKITLTYGAE